TGSLLGDLHDDIEIANALRRGPFEDAFQGFQTPSAAHSVDAKLIRFQEAVSGLFLRLNKRTRTNNFGVSNDLAFTAKDFPEKLSAIVSLDQHLHLDTHYINALSQGAAWSRVDLPGMTCTRPPGLFDATAVTWTPTNIVRSGPGV